jgi:hypothetical protein
MKLALIVEKNPKLYCWIEGYSDLFGADAYNQDLSRRRAAAVKEYLVTTLRLNADRIIPRGYGKAKALVLQGSVEEQAPNRRVEIRMRRTPPPAEAPVVVKQQNPPPAPPASAPEPSREPVLVKPMRALPVAEPVEQPPAPKPAPAPAPRARPVVEDAPRAKPVEEDPPKAEPVQEDEAPHAAGIEESPRAVPVE